MASAGDIGEPAAEATTPARNRRTIYDYLGEGEDGTEEASPSPPSPETPPRLRLPRFTCARIRFGRLGRKRRGRGGRKEAAAAEKREDASVVDSSGWKQPAAGSGGGGSSVAAGQTGMGLSMLFLLARTCVELNRMAEVRAQMETLLKEIRDEASRVKCGGAADHVVLVTRKACNNLQPSSSTTTTASSSSCVSDTSTTNYLVEIRRGEDDGERPSGAEVETELAVRRRQPPECSEYDAEPDTPDQCSVQSSSDDDDDGEFIELEGGRFGTGRGESKRGAVVVVDESDDDESCERRRHEGSVSATELERRLHELQHRRDRERIEVLESALRRARRKLTEKEMEARLWQDTATLALGQPVPRDRDGQ